MSCELQASICSQPDAGEGDADVSRVTRERAAARLASTLEAAQPYGVQNHLKLGLKLTHKKCNERLVSERMTSRVQANRNVGVTTSVGSLSCMSFL